jgi:MFS family permease
MYACWFAAGASIVTGIGVYLLKKLAVTAPPPPLAEPGESASPLCTGLDYSQKPDLAWMGWVAAGTGILVLSFIRGVFPVRAETTLHLTQSLQGLLFFLLSLVQAFTGLFLCRSRVWMYGRGGLLAFGLAGILGSLALGFARTPLMLAIGAILFGLYAGGFFFYMVFHALIHPGRSARYVAINETVVGLASLTGAILGGGIADRFGFGSLYILGAALILATLSFQTAVIGVSGTAKAGSRSSL